MENHEEVLTGLAGARERLRPLLEKRFGTDAPPLAHVHSFGCQQNAADGEKIRGILAFLGFGFTEFPEGADLVIYNTCAVRETAEDRVFGYIGELKHCKRDRPAMLAGVCGCMVQQEHIVERLKASYPYIDFAFGTHVLHELPDILYRTISEDQRVFDISGESPEVIEGLPVRRTQPFRADVPIMVGCNNFCTYCIVPYVRGREKSRDMDAILDEVRALVADGCKEIQLLGQNVNSYGRTKDSPARFPELLRAVNAIPGDFRIRFMTSHPKDASRELIDAMADCEKVMRQLHLPVQAGSDRVLREMNRGYTAEKYLDTIAYARERMPDLSFTSDIMVGFPSEMYEDFLGTLELVKKVRYDNLYTFIYNRRSGTKAASMPDAATDEERGKWFRELLAAQVEIGTERHARFVGRIVRVLPESRGKTRDDMLLGKSFEGAIVEFPGDASLIGEFVNVRVTRSMNWAVSGELVNE